MAELFNTYLKTDANLKAYYRFENNLNDAVVGNNLTGVNAPTYTQGRYGQGIITDFNLSQYATQNTNVGVTSLTAFSYVGWSKLRSDPGASFYPFFFHSNSTSKNSLSMNYTGSGSHNRMQIVYTKNGISTQTYDTSNRTLDSTAYHHYALTYDNATFTIYIDGIVFFTQAYAGGSGSSATGDVFYLNYDGSNVGGYQHDDVAVFNRTLTLQDIQTLAISNAAYGGIL